MRFSVRVLALAVAVLVVPISASAQEMPEAAPVPTAPAVASDSTPVGPAIATSSVAYRPAASADSLATEPQRRKSQGFGQAGAMMIAGGAAVVIGLVIGDDVGTLIAVGGAVVGLYGLYMYLK